MLAKSRPVRVVVITGAVALALTFGSFGLRRHGPEMGEFGNFCGPSGDQPCYRPLLNAGWPLAYVVDAPGVSVEEQLGLEDKVRPALFAADVAFYSGLLLLAWRYGQLRRRLRDELRTRRAAREAQETTRDERSR